MQSLSKLLFLLLPFFTFSQIDIYSIEQIPKELSENANSIIQNQKIEIDILSRKQMLIKKTKTVTILNSKGLGNIDAIEYYDKSSKIKAIEAVIYDSFGKEIKKIKRKDFIDQSIADGFSVYRDDRFLALNYTPISYPFTIVYTSEVESFNTAFIPKWSPVDDYYESVVFSSFYVKYPIELGFKYKEKNFSNYNIKKVETSNSILYQAENLKPIKQESYTPSFNKFYPHVMFGLDFFHLEGFDGNAKTWDDFGKWMYQNLLKETEELPVETKIKIKNLVGTEKNPVEKAKIVYKYVQDKSRYVSVQLGIGGWKPMLVSDVDRLGYGDCKALSNYTRVLLKEVGVESFYTIIYAGNEKQNITDDFVSIQGNHAILALPVKDDYVFMECTSQTSPFGFNGDFTDDRFALIVKPDGGKIVKTNQYNAEKSTQKTTGNYKIDTNGNFFGAINIYSTGVQYENIYQIESKSLTEKDLYYKEHFPWFSNMKINSIEIENNKEKIEFKETISLSSDNYATLNGDLMLLPINAYNRNLNVPQRYKLRENAFEISRGFYDIDEIEVEIPSNYTIDAKPNDILIETKFGKYHLSLQITSTNKINYKRSYLLNNNFYSKEDYEEWRKFNDQINKADQSKIVLKKTNL